jgi:hypothetical protein
VFVICPTTSTPLEFLITNTLMGMWKFFGRISAAQGHYIFGTKRIFEKDMLQFGEWSQQMKKNMGHDILHQHQLRSSQLEQNESENKYVWIHSMNFYFVLLTQQKCPTLIFCWVLQMSTITTFRFLPVVCRCQLSTFEI